MVCELEGSVRVSAFPNSVCVVLHFWILTVEMYVYKHVMTCGQGLETTQMPENGTAQLNNDSHSKDTKQPLKWKSYLVICGHWILGDKKQMVCMWCHSK